MRRSLSGLTPVQCDCQWLEDSESVELLSPDSASPGSEGAQGSPPILETQSGETATCGVGNPQATTASEWLNNSSTQKWSQNKPSMF